MTAGASTWPTVREISQARFDAFVGYCRMPEVTLVSREVAWVGADDNSVFATIIVDTDREFSAIVFLPDRLGRFRWADQTAYVATVREAVAQLEQLLQGLFRAGDNRGDQGDEAGEPVDFFAPLAAEDRLHPTFRRVRDEKGQVSARSLINLMMRWYDDRDGNFIEQFQTSGFDARVWELYLWATLNSLGYEVTRPDPSPDFVARGIHGSFAIEATTVNPSRDGSGAIVPAYRPITAADLPRYADHYLPVRFAGPLTSKLAKRYWERPGVSEMPLVFAIQDFHSDFSMTYSQGGLFAYLYGLSVYEDADVDGWRPSISTHTWGEKNIPSRFFELPESENVSAVLFNSQGTMAKFSRMGIQAGFQRGDVQVLHEGLMVIDSEQGLAQHMFSEEVGPGYWEEWISGMQVFHNPHANRPFELDWMPGAVHHTLDEDGHLSSLYPARHIAKAQTIVIQKG